MRKSLKFLKRVPFFSRLKPRELKAVVKISHLRRYAPGQVVFAKNATAGHMFVVIEGRIKIFTPSPGRKRKTYSYLEPGDFFGEMALLGNKTRSAEAVALEDSSLLLISKADFNRLLRSNADLSYYLLRTLSDRLRKADEEIESLLFNKLFNRLCQTLLFLSGNPNSRGPVQLKRRYTHQELADWLGTAREPVVRGLSILRQTGTIEAEDGLIRINQPEKLRSFCG